MSLLLDTSVLIAASDLDHQHFAASRRLLLHATMQTACCAAHSLAEMYNVLTKLPKNARRSPPEALLLIQQVRAKMSQITLSSDDYVSAIEGLAHRGLIGGMIYDALLLQCARKAEAERIYTWNVRHFRAIAPDLAERIVTP